MRNRAHVRWWRDSRFRVQLGDAEVDDFGEPVSGHHDVLGLEIAMDDAGGVRLGQALCDLPGQMDRAAQRDRALLQHLADRAAIDPFHRDKGRATLAADVMDREDVRMVERGCRARFLLEAGDPIRRGQVGREYLDGDRAPQPRVLGTVHLAHAARAEKRLQDVRTQLSAGGQWHDDADYCTSTSARSLFLPLRCGNQREDVKRHDDQERDAYDVPFQRHIGFSVVNVRQCQERGQDRQHRHEAQPQRHTARRPQRHHALAVSRPVAAEQPTATGPEC
jgi:hypothetical protein